MVPDPSSASQVKVTSARFDLIRFQTIDDNGWNGAAVKCHPALRQCEARLQVPEVEHHPGEPYQQGEPARGGGETGQQAPDHLQRTDLLHDSGAGGAVPSWPSCLADDRVSSYRILRDDGVADAIAGQEFASYEAAYAVLERYYADLCCSDDRLYYRIEETNR